MPKPNATVAHHSCQIIASYVNTLNGQTGRKELYKCRPQLVQEEKKTYAVY